MIERAASYRINLGLGFAASVLLVQGCTADRAPSPSDLNPNKDSAAANTNARCLTSKRFGDIIQAKVYDAATGERMSVDAVQVRLEGSDDTQNSIPDELGRARFNLPERGFYQIFIKAVVDEAVVSCDTRYINRQ